MGKEKKSRLDDAWHWQHDEKEQKHIMTVLDRMAGLAKIIPIHVRFPTFEERHATSSPKSASTAVKMPISLEIAPNSS